MARKKLTEEEKAAKGERVKTKIDKIFITILLLFVLCGIGYAAYKIYENGGINFISKNSEEKKKKDKEDSGTKFVSVETIGKIVIYNDYILDVTQGMSKPIINQVFDLNGKLVYKFEEPLEYDNYYVDSKGALYFDIYEWDDNNTNNNVKLIKVSGGKEDVVLDLEGNTSYFTAIQTMGKNGGIIGYIETIRDEDAKYQYRYFTLGGKSVNLAGYKIQSETSIAQEENYYIYDAKSAVVTDVNELNSKYGIIDLNTGDLLVGLNYTLLHQTYDGNYIARIDGGTGVINTKTKKVLPYEFDFIDRNDGYFIVSKDNKMAILDDDYRNVTDYDFDYQKPSSNSSYYYIEGYGEVNSFTSTKRGDKYLLVINNGYNMYDNSKYNFKKNEAYIIDENGKYETIEEQFSGIADDIVYFVDTDNAKVYVYDGKLNYKYDISLKDYDFKKNDIIIYKNGDLLRVVVDGTTLYFNYEDGKEVDEKIAVYELDDLSIRYDFESKTVSFFDKEDENEDLRMELNRVEDIKEVDDHIIVIGEGRFVVNKQ